MKLKKLLVRASSGLVYCLIIIGATIGGSGWVLALACLFAVLACIEFRKLNEGLSNTGMASLVIDCLSCVALTCGYMVWPLLIWLSLIIVRLVMQLYSKSEHPIRELAISMFTQVYIALPMALMVAMGEINSLTVLAIFILLWINDTGAFITGSLCGRHKLFERISPNKTWEGFAGGLIMSVAASILMWNCDAQFLAIGKTAPGLWQWIAFALTVSIFGTWGDLVESMMKRSLHVKDSGHIMPGHGGVLDRIDSLLLALPASAILLALTNI